MQATAAALSHRALVSEAAKEDDKATTTTALARLQYALQKVRHACNGTVLSSTLTPQQLL